jgi:hypothetical protein
MGFIRAQDPPMSSPDRRDSMRRFVMVVLLIWLLPVGASAGARECRKLTNQISHYEGVVDMARSRGNDLWEAETRRHIGRLSDRRARMCPQYAQSDNAGVRLAKATARLASVAAKAAAHYFTFGWY